MNINFITSYFKKVKFLSHVFSSEEREYIKDSFKRIKASSLLNRNGIQQGENNNFCDFAEFPVITSFINKFNTYPSIVKYDFCVDYDSFLNKTKKINKSFYTDSYHRWVYSGKEYKRLSFACFDCVNRGFYFYITIDTHQEKEKFINISVSVFFDGNTNDTKNVIDIIKNEIYDIEEFKEKDNVLSILTIEDNAFKLKNLEIKCPEIDFDLNYNKDFKPIHDTILDRLSEDKSKGLVLLHGKAGTGKTNYIRYLINHLKKKVIYIPPNMSNSISDPNLIKFFIEHSNSILVIEDAENVLMKRASNSTQAIANILNLTDGLLSDCTNIQVIATFNTDILNIDEALLRKGRLIAKYEFGELETEITEKIAIKIGSDVRGKKVLAEIYNSKDESFTNKKEKIGFNI
jgi:hypothetical protein